VPDERNSTTPSNFPQSRMPVERYKVLFICRDNAVHSIMAEALLKRWGDGDFYGFSAGIKPSAVIDPYTLELLKEGRVWRSDLHPKSYQEFFRRDAPLMDVRDNPRRARARLRTGAMARESTNIALAHHGSRYSHTD